MRRDFEAKAFPAWCKPCGPRVGPWGSYVYPTNWTSDENGNLTVENYVGNVTSYTFDTENRLTKVVQPSGYTEENQYSQDGLRRVRVAGTSTITYLWDDHVLLRDNAIYTTLPGAPCGLLASKGGTTHRFYVPDMQGHVRQVTDIDGDAIAEYQYDAWGLIQLTAASAMAFGDWGYTWDGKPGRYYVQQRHLRADLGRWMSVDPVETEPPYAYVANRPTWAVDPSGGQFGPPRTDPGIEASFYNWVMGKLWGGMESEAHTAGRVLTNPRTYEQPIEWILGLVESGWRAAFEAPENLTDHFLRKMGLDVLTQSKWRAFGHEFPNLWKNAAPPTTNPAALVSYAGGFAFGALEAGVWSVVGLPIDALKLVHYFAGLPQDVWGDLRKLLWNSMGNLRHALSTQFYWRPYDRGKLAGALLVTAIGLILAGKAAASRLRGLTGKLREMWNLGPAASPPVAGEAVANQLVGKIEQGAARRAGPPAWTEVGGLYKKLRAKTPSRRAQMDIQSRYAGRPDPVYGITMEKPATHHLVSVKEAVQYPGFAELSEADQLAILEAEYNIDALHPSINSSVQDTPFRDWFAKGGHREAAKRGWTEVQNARARLIAKEDAARRAMRADIDKLLRGQRGP